MQAHAPVFIISVALLTLSGCAAQRLDDPGQKPARRSAGSGGDYDYTDDDNGGSTAHSGKSNASAGSAGSAGRANGGGGAGGAPGKGGAAGKDGSGASQTASVGGGGSSAVGAGGASSSAECPSLTLARLKSGECVPRVTEYDVAEKPTSIVLGSDGQIWVDDDGSDQLIALDESGKIVSRIDCEAASSPRAMVGGTDDAIVWYTDAHAQALVKVMRDKQQVPTPIGFEASAITLGRNGDVFLTEFGKAVYRVRPDQLPPSRWGSSPTDTIVVSPDKNAVWFSQGSALTQLIPATGTTDFLLSETAYATGLCVGPDDGLWFSDSFADQLVRVSLDGVLSRTINLPTGTAPGRIIVGPDGAFWFAEMGTSLIGRVSLNGEITHYPLPTRDGLPHALTVGSDDNIWFTEISSHKVGRLIPDPLP